MTTATAATLERALSDVARARAYNDWLFERARPHIGRRVLDAGAGLGTFTSLAAATGADVVAVEPVGAFADHLRRRFASEPRVEVVQGEAVDAPAGPFDSVLCLNVLEHVADDTATLHAFHERLAVGGRLLLLVPAHPRLYGAYDRAAGHERRYSKRVLRARLAAAGFAVETLRHVNPVGALGWLVRVTFAREGDWPSTSFALFDRLVPALRPVDRLPLPFGLSLWAVARRVSDA